MTANGLSSGGAGDYADYLEALTVAPEQGDYYLGSEGRPVEAQGVWLARPESLEAVGVAGAGAVDREEFVALMEGRRPGTQDEFLRRSHNGVRTPGTDVVFSAPKSVSVVWGLGSAEVRAAIERAHCAAVGAAFAYVRDTTPMVAEKGGMVVARDVLAAEFRHTTARAVGGRAPDPQLHSHVVMTCAIDTRGSVRAIRARTLKRAAREGGAFYRAALAEQLAREGFALRTQTGKDGRYFEIAGVPDEVCRALSARSREVEQLCRQFEAQHGRPPTENELQVIKVDSRQAKAPATQEELRQSWQATAREHGLHRVEQLRKSRPQPIPGVDAHWGQRVARALTESRATFGGRELRASALEQAAGSLSPTTALDRVQQLVDAGEVIELEGGRLTTRQIREMEQSAAARAQHMAQEVGGAISPGSVDRAQLQVAERLASSLSPEQAEAVGVLSGPARIAVLEGEAGTGKGVVLDVVARAEQLDGRRVIGAALAGQTARRLADSSPALEEHTMTVAALLTRIDRGQLQLDASTTVIVDEAGMVDTPTLEAVVRISEQSGSRLLLVGDRRQLDAIGPGGMFAHIAQHVPLAKVSEVRRTLDPDERKAWSELRHGHGDRALAHYLARGQVHIAEERHHALDAAAREYDQLARQHGHEAVALMCDGSTAEFDRLNARVQHLRAQRGELGEHGVPLPHPVSKDEPVVEVPSYELHAGDEVAWREIQSAPDEHGRIENGTRGTITAVDPKGSRVLVQVAGSGRLVTVAGEELGMLRLGYAGSVYREQGATVEKAVALTGGWQTDRASAYVQASRARDGISWHVCQEDLGEEATTQVRELARRISTDNSKTPSIDHAPAARQAPAGVELGEEWAPAAPQIPGPKPEPRPLEVGVEVVHAGWALDGPFGPPEPDVDVGIEVEL